ncbi:hypothetical protein Q31b_00400 [Novipirellula aureliae]|uniref:DUF1559 domain-containing protein n=1 Tax=Novipirellula aureliae TaxID=2527966 RepID=A0A5C6E7R1_9BACT|nr:DUF1559 domain-containing protein [Novipirellula aureliae]TWU44870.1 hypothetical protein Q31b_00400 [Novipirellula aureliae]
MKQKTAFTMVEVFTVVAIIGVLVGLLLPAIQASREMVRRTSCANNFMQIGLAIHGYHQAFKQLPVQLSGSEGSTTPSVDNDRRLSAFVALLPFLDEQPRWEIINRSIRKDDSRLRSYAFYLGYSYNDGWGMSMDEEEAEEPDSDATWVAGGPEPFDGDYYPWSSEIRPLRCPSDPGIGLPALGRTNYAVCLGDGMVAADSGPMKERNGRFVIDAKLEKQTELAMRGMFVPRVIMRFSDVTDGLSTTIMMAEIATDLGDQSILTKPIAGPGIVLASNPNWARDQQLIDVDRPEFWQMQSNASVLAADNSVGRGSRWADGMPVYTAVNTILPPNREIVLQADRDDTWGVLGASSRHQGGAHVCMGDGKVTFVNDSIDAGHPSAASVFVGSVNEELIESPYGLWGALGTRASHELSAISGP